VTSSVNPYRLPRSVVPSRYTLTLEPDLESASFAGTVDIEVAVNDPVEQIVLNAIELDIARVTVDGTARRFRLDEPTERLTIDASLAVGTSVIAIDFTGTLNDKLRGWYRSTYRADDDSERVIATTQMQATDCRRAFPCFDEPDFKAVFDVTLIVAPDLLAVSNGPEVERIEQDSGKVAVRFRETMPMSTYLVAFVVGPLEATDPVQVPRAGGGTIPLRIVHVPGKGHLTSFGLSAGAHGISWYQHYYGIPYPTDKCDMLALPDFAAGAMENLGCITYRESLLLADPAAATQAELQNLADVITHELAHMWFGDLVTMRWWNGIWLNEAFATFMEIACCTAFRPDWQRWTTFSLERTMAFDVDSLAATRPVEFPVEAPRECEGMFDVLTYQKGASLLRMLEQYLGEEQFRRGVSHYLTTHEYGNTETSDLWDAIEASIATEFGADAPVRKLMDSWIWQPGYPLVSARLDGSTLVLGQQRFGYGDVDDATLFVVPVHLRIDGVESKVLIEGDALRVPLPSADAVVVVNAGGHGFMRVAYDDALRARLVGDALSGLTIVDRYNLVDDAWNAVVAGRLAAADFVTFVEGFAGERELAVWQAIGIGLRGVGRLLDGDPYAAFQRRVAALVASAMAELGWEPRTREGDLVAKLRGLLAGMLAVLGDDADAQARCRAILAGAPRDPELVAAATNAVAAVGTDADYDAFLARFREASTPQERLRHLYALAEFPEAGQVQRTIDLAWSAEVKSQDAPFLLGRCIANRNNGAMAWRAVRQRWAEATATFPDNTIVRMIDPVKLLNVAEVVADVQTFFAEHPIPQAAKTLSQVLERQRVNAALREREAARLSESLA
jgi:puromycin-sensitive aminopeptidase